LAFNFFKSHFWAQIINEYYFLAVELSSIYLKNSAESPLAKVSDVNNVISRKLEFFQLRIELSARPVVRHVARQLVQVDV
jgi:hypothetical protein